jgi:hypothetical protein
LLHPSRPKNKAGLWRPKKNWLSQSGYPRLQCPQRALIRSNQVKKSSHGL